MRETSPCHPFVGRRLVETARLGDPDAVSILLEDRDRRLDVIVVRSNGLIRGYLNSCPHAGTPLETFDGRILDRNDPGVLVCSTHGARFAVETGECIKGPCKGRFLRTVALQVGQDWVSLAG